MVRILKSSWNEKDVVKWFLFFFIFWFLLLNEFYYSKKFMEAAAVGSAIVHIVVALRGRGLIFIVFCFFLWGNPMALSMPWSQRPAPIPLLSPQQQELPSCPCPYL